MVVCERVALVSHCNPVAQAEGAHTLTHVHPFALDIVDCILHSVLAAAADDFAPAATALFGYL